MWPFTRKASVIPVSPEPPARSFFSTHKDQGDRETGQTAGELFAEYLRKLSKANSFKDVEPLKRLYGGRPGWKAIGFATDDAMDASFVPDLKQTNTSLTSISDSLVMWYASQTFIGHQLAGILAQQWLVGKCCSIPARDAIRKGFTACTVDGDELEAEQMKVLKRYDRAFGLNKNLVEFVRNGRIFGIRIAIFQVESTDPRYYEKPFNIDGVARGAYKGIVQVDPYWTAPLLDQNAASKPDSQHFYEPTWWIINGRKYHRSHLAIFRNQEPVDILKPQYYYGGIPVPQLIMERVYGAERTANEAPQLAQTKRTSVWLTDLTKVLGNFDAAIQKLQEWSYYRDNYGLKLGDKQGDQFDQFDTSLSDFDEVIMSQYQLVAACANVPATKLLGTTPKGFNATGEYEESNYHEELESIQTHDLTPLIERHHLLIMKSFGPEGQELVATTVNWEPLDSPTALELAQTNLAKAQTGNQLVQSGAIGSEDERRRVATDPESGYHELGLMDEDNDFEPDEEDGDNQG